MAVADQPAPSCSPSARKGWCEEDDFTHDEPRARAGRRRGALRTEWIGIDATVRTWLSKAEGYIPPVEIGEVVRSAASDASSPRGAQVPEASSSPPSRWQEYAVVGDDPMLTTRWPRGHRPAGGARRLRCQHRLRGLTEVGQVRRARRSSSRRRRRHGLIAVQIAKILGCR